MHFWVPGPCRVMGPRRGADTLEGQAGTRKVTLMTHEMEKGGGGVQGGDVKVLLKAGRGESPAPPSSAQRPAPAPAHRPVDEQISCH